ncbi:precorrin-3B synthase [Xanthobacter sediminis]
MSAAPPLARGWCPGVARPMESGDGLLVRVHPRHGLLSVAQLRGLAQAAAEAGNGLLDITSHANAQIRGVTASTHGPLRARLAALGLDDGTNRAPFRATAVSPLAGLDPEELVDGLALADRVEAMARTVELPPKFLIVVEGGGAYGLDHLAPDIALRAIAPDALALSLAGRPTLPAGHIALAELETALPALLGAVAKALARTGAWRVRALSDDERRRLLPQDPWQDLQREAVEMACDRAIPGTGHTVDPSPAPPVGRIALRDGYFGIMAAAPFGQVGAQALAGVADLISRLGLPEVRLTPRRGLLLPGLSASGANEAVRTLSALGFITDPADRRLNVITCAGAPGCAKARCDSRALAARLAAAWPHGAGTAHLSACAKGCARRGPSALTLVAEADGFALIRNGGPFDRPCAHLPFDEILRRLAAPQGLDLLFRKEDQGPCATTI